MERKSIVIDIPDGMCIDESKSTFEKIVFKKKECSKPRSWEEYCNNLKGEFYYIRDDRDSIGKSFTCTGVVSAYKNYVPSKELAEAFLAMMQLMSLRQAWIGDWEPDWKLPTAKYCIFRDGTSRIAAGTTYCAARSLSFPTKEMAEYFIDCFKDLLNTARSLI